jgi:membrane-associated phospholipid phosphatase
MASSYPYMKKTLVFGFIFFLVFQGKAQDRPELKTRENFYQTDSLKRKHAWLGPAIAVGYAGATYACYLFLDSRIQDESQEGKTGFSTRLSSSIGHLGLGRFQSIAWGSTTALALITKNKKLQKTVIIWAGSLLLNSTITDQLKISFQRHRPSSGDPYNVFDWRGGPRLNNSFPSAHTSNAFTTATVFASLYGDHHWVPPLAYGLATLVGLSRIYDNAHWASDVMTGAAVGFLSAKAMTALYRLASKKILFLPQAGTRYISMTLVCRI